MRRPCHDCKRWYDDARASTLCPHLPLMSDADLAQKDAGIKLLGKYVYFIHRPEGVPPARVSSVSWNGMVTLDGWSGEFAPHLFVIVEPCTESANTKSASDGGS